MRQFEESVSQFEERVRQLEERARQLEERVRQFDERVRQFEESYRGREKCNQELFLFKLGAGFLVTVFLNQGQLFFRKHSSANIRRSVEWN